MLVALLLLTLALTVPGWLLSDASRTHLLGAAAGVAMLIGLGCWMLVDPAYAVTGDAGRGIVTILIGLLAVFGGGPVTAAALHRLDTGIDAQPAGNVLRGGAWIGAMERVAIFATVASGWPEGLAVVLAVKGLGRYPELKAPGAAERFIIGTFASVIWALANAGLLVAVLR